MRILARITPAIGFVLLCSALAAQARSMPHPAMRHHPFLHPSHHYPLRHHPGVYVHHGTYTARYRHH